MHYHWQVLVKAPSKEDAEAELHETMSEIDTDNVKGIWDWYVIGGRWNEKENTINGTHPEFWNRINEATGFQKAELKRSIERLVEIFKNTEWTIESWIRKTDDDFESIMKEIAFQKIDDGMATYYLEKIIKIKNGECTSSSYFVTSGDVYGDTKLRKATIEEIKNSPKDYWLINVDIHN